MKIYNFFESIKGKYNEVNQDCILVDSNLKNGINFFAVIADGMGGLDYGDLASNESVKKLSSIIKKIPSKKFVPFNSYISDINSAFIKVNKHVREIAKDKNAEMGSTLSFVMIVNETLYLGHAGDSAIHLISNPKTNKAIISKLTVDHNAPGSSNIITKSIGIDKNIDPQISKIDIKNDSIILLSSDGLTDVLREEEILGLILKNKFSKAPSALIKAAKEKDSYDDISVAMIIISK